MVVRGRMKIGNGHLGTQVVVIDVTTTTTAAEIVSKALIKFGMEVGGCNQCVYVGVFVCMWWIWLSPKAKHLLFIHKLWPCQLS